ncbi:MAG: pimeloyl-ACP methyl ester esterase BioH [Gammaproteobacteria bacterium]|nr:pimeloyl-ACP methyl ester esterase BioH [Gammaproteobacteria bacterium]
MTLACETVGNGPDLVLLHGWGMNSGVWQPLLERMSQGHRLWLIDLPGHGNSPLEACCTDLDAWAMACLDVAPPMADWLGWSLGGQVALAAALAAPGRIGRLALVGTNPSFIQRDGWQHAMAVETLAQFATSLSVDHQQTLSRFLTLQVRGSKEANVLLRDLKQSLSLRPAPTPEALAIGLDLLLQVDLRNELKRLECPVRWLLGERDTLVPAAVAADINRLFSSSDQRVIRGAAHTPFLSHQTQFVELLSEFLV